MPYNLEVVEQCPFKASNDFQLPSNQEYIQSYNLLIKQFMRLLKDYLIEIALIIAAVILLYQLVFPSLDEWLNQPTPGKIVKQQFEWNQGQDSNTPIRYWLYLPKKYHQMPQWPLVIYLHGTGGRGFDLQKIYNVGPLNSIREGNHLSAIVVVPQCPSGLRWDASLVEDLLQDVSRSQKMNSRKIYLTGYSMGGYGTWKIGSEIPDKFAAIVPIAGGGDTVWATKLFSKPIWAFHGAKDRIVSIDRTHQMIEAVEQAGGTPKFTTFPKSGHSINSLVFENKSFWEWLFEQELPNKVEED